MAFHIAATGVVLFLVFLHPGQSQSEPFDAEDVSSTIEETYRCHNNPGLAVSVVKNGKVLLSRGFGVTDLDTREPVSNTTVFGIASVSKAFASTLLVKLLYEKTNFTVDSKVRDFLGEEFQMSDAVRTEETTFADLMGHRTAVPPNNRIRFDTNFTREAILQRLHLLPSPDQFRVKYYYNNLIYGLVTRLAELIGQKAWEDLVTEHLFQPLGMKKSTFATMADFSRQDIAVGYIENQENLLTRADPEFSRRWAELAGSGSVMTTANDMIHWMNFHLYNGQSSTGEQVMRADHLAEVHKPRFMITPTVAKDTRIPTFPVTASESVYAHGFRLGFYRGYERMTHTGSTIGYKAILTLLPEEKIGIFTALSGLDNNYAFRVPLHMYLMDKALGLEPWLNASTICSYPEPWKSKVQSEDTVTLSHTATPKYQVDLYQGTYYNDAYGYVHVTWNNTLSALVLTYGWGTWQLKPQPSNKPGEREKFYGTGLDITAIELRFVYFIFDSDTDKDVTVIGIDVSGFDSNVVPRFKKPLKTSSEACTGKDITVMFVGVISLAAIALI